MRAAFLVRVVPPSIDGVGDYTYLLAKELRHQGVDARIWTSANQEISSGDKAWIYPAIEKWTPSGVVSVLNRSEFRADWVILQYVPQLYGKRGICWSLSGLSQIVKKQTRSRMAVTFHEITLPWAWHPSNIVLGCIMRLQAKRLLKYSDLAVATCPLYGRLLEKLSSPQKPASIIPVGTNIDPSEFSADEISEVRKEYGIENTRVMGIFGRFTKDQRLRAAVQVLTKAKEESCSLKLMVIGRTESDQSLYCDQMMREAEKKGVRDQIVFSGENSPRKISAILQIVDVFLFLRSSGISTGSGSAMAALAHGLPIVSFGAGHGLDLKVPVGFRVPSGNEDLFVEQVMSVLRSKKQSGEKAGGNSVFYQRNFSWPVIAGEYRKKLGDL